MVAEPGSGMVEPVVAGAETVDENEKVMKIVAITVEKVIERLMPQLQRHREERSRRETVGERKRV
eukprot:2253467-Karenia_brevis.AAC.1